MLMDPLFGAEIVRYRLSVNRFPSRPVRQDARLGADPSVASEVVGLTIGDGRIERRSSGATGSVDLSDGIKSEIRVSAIPDATGALGKLFVFSLADITGYVPDLDTTYDQIPLVGNSTPTTRTGTGETPIGFLKAHLDVDVFHRHSRSVPASPRRTTAAGSKALRMRR